MATTSLDLDPLLTPTQVCRELGYGRTKVLSLIKLGRLPCLMDNGRIRVRRSVVLAYKDSLPIGYTIGKAVR